MYPALVVNGPSARCHLSPSPGSLVHRLLFIPPDFHSLDSVSFPIALSESSCPLVFLSCLFPRSENASGGGGAFSF